jgi:16S rRNA A1518/A1519 N6-dimethyltransferase RsmA/KsgA/DIM1 with predicted DNA glycosylase/AP lyase activity
MMISNEFGQYYTFCLLKSAKIVPHDALEVNWEELISKMNFYTHIIGNPPFIGSNIMSQFQREIKLLKG